MFLPVYSRETGDFWMPRFRYLLLAVTLGAMIARGGSDASGPNNPEWVSFADGLRHKLDMTNVVHCSDGILFSNDTHTLRLYSGHREIELDGVNVWMNLPPHENNSGELTGVARVDYDHLLRPILASSLAPTSAPFRIVLDPGHGGHDTGAVSTQPSAVEEKAVALDIARRVATHLEAAGHQVWIVRTNDVFIVLGDRARFATQHKAQIFVSIHANSSLITPSASGIETYVLSSPGFPGTDENSSVSVEPMTGNHNDSENAMLGFSIQHRCVPLATTDRGLKRARFLVLREAHCPATLVECGFLSSAQDAASLSRAAYRERFATAIAGGIMDYARMMTRVETPPPADTNEMVAPPPVDVSTIVLPMPPTNALVPVPPPPAIPTNTAPENISPTNTPVCITTNEP